MASVQEIMHKKVAGIPVVYLGGAAAIVLAIIAYRMRNNNPAPATATDGSATGIDANGAATATDESLYGGLATNGTVVVAPQAPAAQDVVQATNDSWLRSSVADVVKANLATAGDAQAALSKYLAGDNLSFDEGKIRDYALKTDGLPPEPLQTIGTVSTPPAQKQFSVFPGTHTVKGDNDNTPEKLAQLYYGRSDYIVVDSIVSQNYNLGPRTAVYTPGTVVHIPAYTEPRYFTAVKGYQYPTQIAAKNGISYAQLLGLNPGASYPLPIGRKIRVL